MNALNKSDERFAALALDRGQRQGRIAALTRRRNELFWMFIGVCALLVAAMFFRPGTGAGMVVMVLPWIVLQNLQNEIRLLRIVDGLESRGSLPPA
jgi:hypothetical protein